ncbi:MAG TPA: ISNCY family transposase [Longimicrobium sp.]|nr:ISNCY family transposase [Longimicrobium sp.]
MLNLSQNDRDRVVVLHQVQQRQLSISEAARRLGVGVRHMRRVLRRFEREGDGSVVHGLRDQPSNRRIADGTREAALARARDPLYHDFGPTLLSEHLARGPAGISVCAATLRLWMIEAGLWVPAKRGKRHRRRRERRAAVGELVLMDTSIHAWLEKRSEEEMVLIALIDDATSRLHARFFPRDTGAANRQMIVDYLAEHGRMGALYTDAASHFDAHFRKSEREAADLPKALTLIRRALGALDVELIIALSPQAKGRVERLFKTLQDRLIKEMRIAGITSMVEANRFLDETFIPFWSGRFTVLPASSADAHRELPAGVDLLRLFAETDQRVVRNDFTFRYRNQHYQIGAAEADGAMPTSRVTIEHRLDGTTRYRWREHDLAPLPIHERPPPAALPLPPAPLPPRAPGGAAGKPVPPTHPWRKNPLRVGRGRFTPLPNVAYAPAALQPDTPSEADVLSLSL